VLKDLKALVARSADTLAEDFLGLAALVVMLYASLHLPGVS
jgi:hypothetical protein